MQSKKEKYMINKKWRENNPEKYKLSKSRYEMEHKKDIYEKRESKRASIKVKVMSLYGDGMCGNCHCSDIDVLTIDHINNDGAKQRMNGMRDGNNLYRELSKVPKRNDLQVLCANCQWRKFICKDPIWLSKQGMKSFLAEKIKSTDLRYWKQYNLRIKHLVMKKYGGICTGCGCEDLLVLTIDHINNDGHKDRKEKRGQGFYMHLLKIPNRADLQVLCFNCQTKKAVLRARATRFSSRDLVAQASRSSALHIISV